MASCWINTFNWDFILGIAHGAQAIIYTALAFDSNRPARIPVLVSLPNGRPGNLSINYQNVTEGYTTYDYNIANIGIGLFVFFYVTAIAHFIRAWGNTIHNPFCGLRNKYKTDPVNDSQNLQFMKKQRDQRNWDRMWRWMEYSITSTTMIIIIFLQIGISNLFALIGNAGANFAMIMFGMAGDLTPPYFWPKMKTFLYGSIVGLVPWLCIFWQIALAPSLPAIIWAIVFTLFFLFFSFAIAEFVYIWSFPSREEKKEQTIENIQMEEKWREGVEFAYQILSAVAKTLLGGLVAGATLTIGANEYVNTM